MSPQWRRRSWLVLGAIAAAGMFVLAVFAWRRFPLELARTMIFVGAAWSVAACLTFAAFVAVSVDDVEAILSAAVRGSAPAMWLAPSLLLLSFPYRAAEALGLTLIAAASCLLAAQRAPRQPAASQRRKAGPIPPVLFLNPGVQTGIGGSLFPVMLGVLALHAGMWCWYEEYRLASAGATALACVIWTRSWVSRIAAREPWKPASPTRSMGAIAFALLLTAGASVASFDAMPDAPRGDAALSANLLEESRRTLERLVRPDPPKTTAPPHKAIAITGPREKGAGGTKGIPGLILRSKTKSRPQSVRLGGSIPGPPLLMAESLTFPFTGEYHIFRTSSGQVPDGAAVEEGTPLDAVYVSTNGGSMQTQAYQALNPPVDFTHCGQIHLTLRSGEIYPASASLQLITGKGVEDLGAHFFGLDQNVEETLPYFVPAVERRLPVTAIRLVFQHDPSQGVKSTKVEVVRFTLVHRSY